MQPKLIPSDLIRAYVIDAIAEIYCHPQAEILALLSQALDREKDDIARDMLTAILENAKIADKEKVPACQDTGLLIVFARMGTAVLIEGGTLKDIIQSAAEEAWQRYYLRDSIAQDPLLHRSAPPLPAIDSPLTTHPSPLSSLPLILHLEQIHGDELILDICLKGGGAENCSVLKMFDPTTSAREIEDFIVSTVVSAGGKPCPPVIVGVGIGGDFELCALLAKKALVVAPDSSDRNDEYRQMEQSVLDRINQQGKGVQGFAGSTTALEIRIRTAPCHIASLPVAVNIECHSHRCTSRKL